MRLHRTHGERTGVFKSASVLAGLGAAAVLAAMPAIAADQERGMQLAEQWCNSCHSIGVEEPRQADAGPQFAELAKKDMPYLEEAINRPHDFMPDFPQLSEEDKQDLIAYIQSVE